MVLKKHKDCSQQQFWRLTLKSLLDGWKEGVKSVLRSTTDKVKKESDAKKNKSNRIFEIYSRYNLS